MTLLLVDVLRALCTESRDDQQVVAAVLQLGGTARDTARELTPAQIATGDTNDFGNGPQHINGHMLLEFACRSSERTTTHAV